VVSRTYNRPKRTYIAAPPFFDTFTIKNAADNAIRIKARSLGGRRRETPDAESVGMRRMEG
jgi:hypothetical protein